MAKVKKSVKQDDGSVVEETIEDTTGEVIEETPAVEEPAKEETPVVTNVVTDIIASAEAVPGPEIKLEIPPTVAEIATSIIEGDLVEISGIRGFEGISGKVFEIRPDGYIVIKAQSGTFAAPKANVVKVK